MFFSGSIGSGLLLGLLFVALWRRCAPSEANRRFWAALGDITKRLMAVDELRLLLALYRRLALELGGYLLRNLGGLVLACLPLAGFLIFAAPTALASWDRHANRVALVPAVGEMELAAQSSESLASALGRWGIEARLHGAPPVQRTAVCWTDGYCAILRMLGFHVIERQDAVADDAPYLVIRAYHGDINPLWPYLNDLEFAFMCAFVAATLGGLYRGRAR